MVLPSALLLLLPFLGDVVHGASQIPAYQLPSYFEGPCIRSDPKVTECIKAKGNKVIKRLSQGDAKYHIPQTDPLVIDELRLGRGTKQVGLTMVCTKCALYGLKNAKLVTVKADWEKGLAQWGFTVDKLETIGKYNVSGQVLILPITGTGTANMTFVDLAFDIYYQWKNEKRSNGLQYTKIIDPKLEINTGKLIIKLDNLFNGDKLLGDNMNIFLNENWQELWNDIKPSVIEAMTLVFQTSMSAVANVVPFENLFPEK